jgi:hypothetical protein
VRSKLPVIVGSELIDNILSHIAENYHKLLGFARRLWQWPLAGAPYTAIKKPPIMYPHDTGAHGAMMCLNFFHGNGVFFTYLYTAFAAEAFIRIHGH